MEPKNQENTQHLTNISKTGLYWRRSRLNDRKSVPVIMTLDGRTLTMAQQSGVVFSVPLSEVSDVRITGFQTLTLKINGTTSYALVGLGGLYAPQFSQQQKDQLQMFVQDNSGVAAGTAVNVNVAVNGAGSAATGLSLLFGAISASEFYNESGRRIHAWAIDLQAAGLPVKVLKPITATKIILISAVATFAVFFGPVVLIILIYLIAQAF